MASSWPESVMPGEHVCDELARHICSPVKTKKKKGKRTDDKKRNKQNKALTNHSKRSL